MHGKALRYVCRQFHESHSKLSSDQTGRSALAALQSDENPERGLSGAHRERESRRTALAVAAQELIDANAECPTSITERRSRSVLRARASTTPGSPRLVPVRLGQQRKQSSAVTLPLLRVFC